MTTDYESERARAGAEQLLIDLLTFPRVPKQVRHRARQILRHLPRVKDRNAYVSPMESTPERSEAWER